MNKPKVSIIITVYNVNKYLDRCINSIINQTYKNLEIIIVNDGSTDGSDIICTNFKKIDDRIVLIHKKNGGLSSARNTALEIVTGDFIAFIDSDDWVTIDMIDLMINAYLQTDCKILICDMLISNEKYAIRNFRYDWDYYNERIKVINSNDVIKLLAFEDFILITNSVCNKIFKEELFKNIRFPLGKNAEDTFIMHKLILSTDNICIINSACYYYFSRPNSITRTVKNNSFMFDLCEAHIIRYNELKDFKYIDNNTKEKLFKNAMEKIYFLIFNRNYKFRKCDFIIFLDFINKHRINIFTHYSSGIKIKLLLHLPYNLQIFYIILVKSIIFVPIINFLFLMKNLFLKKNK